MRLSTEGTPASPKRSGSAMNSTADCGPSLMQLERQKRHRRQFARCEEATREEQFRGWTKDRKTAAPLDPRPELTRSDPRRYAALSGTSE